MKRLEMDNVVEDKEVPSSSTAEASATASPGTDDLGPVHLEALGPVHLEAQGPVHLEALGPVHLEALGPVHLEAQGPGSLERQQEGGVWVIHPLSSFSHDGDSFHMGFSLFCDTMFLVDIALNFRMGIMSKDREEILTAVCRTLLKKVPMFKAQGANFINAVLPKLVFEVFQEGDIIFREKAPGDRMFFISEGNVGIEMDGVQRELFDGDYFGEVGLLKHGMRAATARALTICRVFSLSADSLHQILHSFPHVKQQIQETAVRRGRNN
ncbi:unnamed protein product [Merluccius merluccius]